MCGIFTAIKKNRRKVTENEKQKILALLKQRGPDSNDDWENDDIYLAHTRLKIIDLDDKANQPFVSQNNRYVMIYNGECYNFVKLKKELESKGVLFRTKSDTEVVLEAFVTWGENFIHKIAGMFSIIIYDKQDKKTYVWRDRLGVKPLYICNNKEGIFLSSSITPILLFNNASLNHNALWSYFNLRFTQGENTMFENIKEVAPGSCTIFYENKMYKEYKYWDMRKIEPQIHDLKTIQETLNNLLNQVVAEYNVADTNIASFLSGGIDSSVIAAYSAKTGSSPHTFTYSTGLNDDEGKKAKDIATYLGLKNTNIMFQQSDFNNYRDSIYALEDPIGDSIIMPTMLLSKAVGKSHKVVLSGEGADEIFSGYVHQQILTLENQIYRNTPDFLWRTGGKILSHVPLSILDHFFPYPSSLGFSGRDKVAAHLQHVGNEFRAYMDLVGLFTDKESKKIFKSEFQIPDEMKNYWESMNNFSFSNKIKRFDLNYWARNYTLHRLDKLSMINSVEARVPFFDHRIVEHLLSIDASSIFNFKDPKMFFRQSVDKNILPKNVLKRKKQAFYLPIEKVLSGRLLKSAKENILDNAKRRSLYNQKMLEMLLSRKNQELLDAKQFQCLYNFEVWCQEFLD